MRGKINNGSRVHVETESFTGLAGYEEIDGRRTLGFVPTSGSPRDGQEVTVDGQPFVIVGTPGYGNYVAGLRLVTIKEVSK